MPTSTAALQCCRAICSDAKLHGIGAQTTNLLAEFTCQWQYDKWGQPEQDGQNVQKPEKKPTPEAPDQKGNP